MVKYVSSIVVQVVTIAAKKDTCHVTVPRNVLVGMVAAMVEVVADVVSTRIWNEVNHKTSMGAGGNMTCYNCNETGHMSRECTKERSGGYGGGGGGRGGGGGGCEFLFICELRYTVPVYLSF
jgi:uncharacterized membrane protein YgcG